MNPIERNAAMLYAVALLTVFPVAGGHDSLPSSPSRVLSSFVRENADAALDHRVHAKDSSGARDDLSLPWRSDEDAACDFIFTPPAGPQVCLWIRW